jgi:hypothetical protein
MALGDEFLSPTNSRVAVDAGTVEDSVFLYIVPADFVRALYAACRNSSAVVTLGLVSN